MRTPEENKEAAREFMERVMNKHDLAYAEESIADSFIEHNPLDPRMGGGKQAAMATFEAMFAASPDTSAEILDLVATGNRIAIRSRFTGTDSGTGWGAPMGAPATGKSFALEGIDVVIIGDDGKFTEHYGIFDVMGMMGQLGLLPAPGGAGEHEH